jgi:polyhydroxybutyrate depolymerase
MVLPAESSRLRTLALASLAAIACGGSASVTPAPSDSGGSSGGSSGSSGGSSGASSSSSSGSSSGGSSSSGSSGGATQTCTGKTAQPLDKTWTITSSGVSRTANVHVPVSYDPTQPTPVVLNFHGFTSDATQQAFLTQMTPKADAEGFIVVYPQGLNDSWNAGACCGQSASSKVDDVRFVSDLLDALAAQICVDAKRVFATGMSNGGFLSHRLACELSDRIAAVAPVAGVLGIPTCAPPRAVPVMHFHGTADPLVPYYGSPTLGFVSVPDTFSGWSARDACSGSPVETYRNNDSHCSTYETCGAGATVTLCTVDGGGHTWPGGTPVPSLGYTTPNLSATDAMWAFFTKHPLP